MQKKNFFINTSLLLGSLLFTVLVCEFIFPRILNKIPLTAIPGLDDGLKILAQTSKKSVVPKNYIALVGDSNAEGLGDWLKDEIDANRLRFATPDYHSAHRIYRKTGRDVISFGVSGAGSLRGLVVNPVSCFSYLNSLKAFSLEKPEKILVYFYEGNDLIDNTRDFKALYWKKYDGSRIYETGYFKEFIERMIILKTPILDMDSPWKNFLFLKYLKKGLKNCEEEVDRFAKKLRKRWGFAKKTKETEAAKPPSIPNALNAPIAPKKLPVAKTEPPPPAIINKVIVAGQEVVIPNHSQAPSMELTDEQTKLGLYVFEQSLLYLSEFFHDVPIGIVYIPSPLSSYELASPILSTAIHMGVGDRYDAPSIQRRSSEICREVEKIASSNHFEFLDSRKTIREASAKELLHGPRDWNHLNKKGYHALSEAVIKAFFGLEPSSGSFGCE